MYSKLREYLKKYHDHFGSNYEGLGFWNDKTDEEAIEEIKECIRTNTPQKKIDFDKNIIY